MSVAYIQLWALLFLVVGAIVFVLVVHNWAEWSYDRRRAGVMSRFARWRLDRRLARQVQRASDELAEALR